MSTKQRSNDDVEKIFNKTQKFVESHIQNRLKYGVDIQNAIDEASTIVITDEKGIITYVNHKFCDISKYSEEELLGNNTSILKSEYHSPEFYSNLWETISNGKVWMGDIQNKTKDGAYYWLRTTIIPIFDKHQKIRNYVSIRTDITSQIELSNKLLKTERMSSIGELASRMAHDIRNPLSIITVALYNLKTKHRLDDDDPQIMKMKRSIDRISHQVTDVLDFVKEQHLEVSKVKVSEIILESLEFSDISDSTKILLPKNDCNLVCDKNKITSCLNNLILNGIQAIDRKGTIEIRVSDKQDSVIIQVQDSGKGISKENMPKVFEPLYTTKQHGTGLGLASVESIIRAHGGTISVTSPPTIFTIILPNT